MALHNEIWKSVLTPEDPWTLGPQGVRQVGRWTGGEGFLGREHQPQQTTPSSSDP